jgi:hypothetical protein
VDWWLIVLRLVHVVPAMLWLGGAVLGGFFLQPAAAALGPAGQSFMEYLIERRRMGVFFPIVATLTILGGAALYWVDSGGLQLGWITSPTGVAFTIGGLAALIAFVGGLILIGPSIAEQTALHAELAGGDGVATDDQRRRLARAEGRMRLASRVDMPLLLLSAVTMAIARYL